MDYFDNYLNSLKELISYKSVESAPKDNKPFGEGVDNAYRYFMDLSKSFGFTTKNYDNYMGEVIYGEGEELGIIGHLDVVPEGDGWETDPFTLTEKDGILYGRGILDDKGPLLACLYALKELKDSNAKCNKKFRLFVGLNEETGWKDVEYFNTKSKFPSCGFSPDGVFPVSYAEKGVLIVEFKLKKLKNFYGIKGGTVINAVCGKAEVKSKIGVDEKLLSKHGLKLKGDKIISIGKSAHGSCPEQGINAIKKLYEYFLDAGEDVKDVLDFFFFDKLKIMELENEQGKITFSPDLIEEKEDYISLKCDCRIPAPFTFNTILKEFEKFNIPFNVISEKHPPVMTDKNGKFVQTMLNAYNGVTGENLIPLSMGGSTFARVFENGCSFGPEFADIKPSIHEANENVPKNVLKKIYQIYKKAIFDLSK